MATFGKDQHVRMEVTVRHEVDRLFNQIIHSTWQRVEHTWAPQVNVYEDDDQYVIEIELPGVGPDDFQVILQGRTLMVEGTRPVRCRQNTTRRVMVAERCFGRFQRRIELPLDADIRGIEQQFEFGLLNIIVPKRRSSLGILR